MSSKAEFAAFMLTVAAIMGALGYVINIVYPAY